MEPLKWTASEGHSNSGPTPKWQPHDQYRQKLLSNRYQTYAQLAPGKRRTHDKYRRKPLRQDRHTQSTLILIIMCIYIYISYIHIYTLYIYIYLHTFSIGNTLQSTPTILTSTWHAHMTCTHVQAWAFWLFALAKQITTYNLTHVICTHAPVHAPITPQALN